ncbi:chaperone protein DnaJ [Pseudoscourfieldia marina]
MLLFSSRVVITHSAPGGGARARGGGARHSAGLQSAGRQSRRLERSLRVCVASPSSSSSSYNTNGDDNDAPPPSEPHIILGVPRDATQEEVKHAYKQLMRIYHPDVVAAKFGTTNTQRYYKHALRINDAKTALLSSSSPHSPQQQKQQRKKGQWGPRVKFTPGEDAWTIYTQQTPSKPPDYSAFAKAASAAAKAHARRRREEASRKKRRQQEEKRMRSLITTSMLPAALCVAIFAWTGMTSVHQAPAEGDCRQQGGGLCRFF